MCLAYWEFFYKNIPQKANLEQSDLIARDYILMAMDFIGYQKRLRATKMLLQHLYGINFNRKKYSELFFVIDIGTTLNRETVENSHSF